MLNGIIGAFMKFVAAITALMLAIAGVGGIGSKPGNPEVKNVILFIGDGMGENHLEWTKTERNTGLVLDTFPIQGYSETNDYMGLVTDSAAGATALSCGVRTISGTIGVYPTNVFGGLTYPMNLCELAIEKGLKTGIVTSDSTSGATPAGFSAHTLSRDNEKPITTQQLASKIDLIWGAPTDSATEEAVGASDFTLVKSLDDIAQLTDGEQSFGQFSGNVWQSTNAEGPTLTELTVAALNRLDNENGFFIMIEGAHIDKRSHSNVEDEMMDAVLEFDNAIAAALEFAQNDGETMIVVTADHETGAIKKDGNSYKFTSGSHSGVNVPLRVFGTDSFVAQGKSIMNRMIPVIIADKLGCEKQEFPRTIQKDIKLPDLPF